MTKNTRQEQFDHLRDQYPIFVFEACEHTFEGESIKIRFHFHYNGQHDCRPELTIPVSNDDYERINSDLLENFIFHIGMVEMVSYWKATCSPVVLVKPFRLLPEQQSWWKKLYFHGLGEFFYLNGIQTDESRFLNFDFPPHTPDCPGAMSVEMREEVIIPVGGGKDSVVTLALLQQMQLKCSALVVNQRGATRTVLDVAGLQNPTVEVKRSIDKQLLRLNDMGYLNGHTPFSALLAFVSALVACLGGQRHIALSNEASANEATIPGTKVNHQYSKSFEFEHDFRSYLHRYLSPDVNYFSMLRPLNELQIAALFAQQKAYHPVFKSCNAGSKTDIWCCNCPKCLFTHIMLAPFLKPDAMKAIFGEDLFAKATLIPYLEQLAGIAEEKPFECVGTLDEVNAALQKVIKDYGSDNLPVLLEHYRTRKAGAVGSWTQEMQYWNAEHALERDFEQTLKKALETLSY